MRDGPSSEAVTLAKQMEEAPGFEPGIAGLRAGLQAIFRRRSERAVARHAVTVSEDKIAGLRCLIIEPTKRQTETTVLYLYGGGYVSGAPELELPIAAHLSEACGARLVLPDYPLAPEHPFPAAIEKTLPVYEALAAQAPVALSGESAGGGLALALLPRVETPPSALCLFSPWVDLTAKDAPTNDPSLTLADLQDYAAAFCPKGEQAQASPALLPLPKLPPTHITSGTRDILLPMIQAFAAKHDADLHVWPGLWHVFELYDELPEAAQSLDLAASFLRQHCA